MKRIRLTNQARELRKASSDAERILWAHLRNGRLNGHKFRRQAPVGPYIPDFVCFEKRLIVELDGGHHGDRVLEDAERTSLLQAEGFKVLRFWNNQVLLELHEVKEAIAAELSSSP